MRLRLNLGQIAVFLTLGGILLFGGVSYFRVRVETSRVLWREAGKWRVQAAKALSIQVLDPVLLDDQLTLRRLIERTAVVDPEIAYVFIVGPTGQVVAHTFSGGFPAGLLDANPLPTNKESMMRRIVDPASAGNSFRDVVVPIGGGYAGFVHIGFHENMIEGAVREVERAVGVMVAAFIVLGILAAVLLSRWVTRPLVQLTEAAGSVGLDELKHGPPALAGPGLGVKRGVVIETEVDQLTAAFREMMERLANAYQDLERVQNKLRRSERLSAIGTVAAGLTHELNNPIAGLRSCIRRIRRNPVNEAQNIQYLGIMEESIERMRRVVAGLLDLAKPRAPRAEETALEPLLQRVARLTEHKIAECRAPLNIEVTPETLTVRADPTQLEHILTNLVANACDSLATRKAAEPKFRPRLRIRAEEEGDHIVVWVIDNGRGIRDDHLERIFDPFFTTKDPGKGTGLGLAICRDMARSHGGEIEVASKMGHGALFRLTLPKEPWQWRPRRSA